MRRTPGASASRLCGRVCAIPLIAGHAARHSRSGRRATRQPGQPRGPRRRRRQRQPEAAGPRRRHPGQAGECQQGDRRRADGPRQRGRRPARTRRQWTACQGCEHRDRGRAGSLRHVRRRDVCERSVELLPDRVRSQRHPQHRRNRADAGGQHPAGDQRSAAGPHRAGEQGVGRTAGQAERRSGCHRCGSQPADRGVGADRCPADVQRPAGRVGQVDGRTRRGASQTRRG